MVNLIDPFPNTPVDEVFARDICKIGQRELCCRYLTHGRHGWSCEKLRPAMRVQIDQRVADGQFTAQGDNCGGRMSR